MVKKVILALAALVVLATVGVVLMTIDSWPARIVIILFIGITIPAVLRKEPQEPEEMK